MNKMCLFGLGFCDHVIDVHLYLFIYHVMKKGDHCLLICCPSIFQYKWNQIVAEDAPWGNECSLFHVFWRHFDLVVAGEAIHERKY